jgi:hypothetical protein
LVSTNRERFDLTKVQAEAFAKQNGTVVIRWRKRIREWKGVPRQKEKALQEDPLFWEYFVSGAPCVITSNINVKMKIANGTEGKCHTITMRDAEDQTQLQHQLQNALPGTVIDLKRPPYSVNIELKVNRNDWTGHSLEDD